MATIAGDASNKPCRRRFAMSQPRAFVSRMMHPDAIALVGEATEMEVWPDDWPPTADQLRESCRCRRCTDQHHGPRGRRFAGRCPKAAGDQPAGRGAGQRGHTRVHQAGHPPGQHTRNPLEGSCRPRLCAAPVRSPPRCGVRQVGARQQLGDGFPSQLLAGQARCRAAPWALWVWARSGWR